MSSDIESINFSNNIKNIIKNEHKGVKRIKQETTAAISMSILEFAKILATQVAVECNKHGQLANQKDLVDACKALGFPQYADLISNLQMPKRKEKVKPKEVDLTEEEMIKLQAKLRRDAVEEEKRKESFGF